MLVCLLVFFTSFAVLADSPNDKLTFNNALDVALSSSFVVKDKVLDIQAENVGYAQSLALASPNLSVNWNLTKYNEAIPALGEDGTPEHDSSGKPLYVRPSSTSNGSLTFSQPLTALIGSLVQVINHRTTLKKNGYDLQNTRAEVAFLAAESYRQVQKAYMVFHIAKERIDLAEKQRYEAEAGYRLGRLSKSDLLILDVLVNKAKVQALQEKSQFESYQAQFLSALNYPIDRQFVFDEIPLLADEAFVIDVPALSEARDTALSLSSSLKAAKFGLRELKINSWLPMLGLAPNVSAFVKIDHNFGQMGTLAIRNTQSFGIMMQWDVWNGGQPFFATRQNQITMIKAKNKVALAERELSLAVLNTRSALLSASKTLVLQQSMLAQSKEAYRGINEKFRLGVTSVTELVQAENTFNQTKVDVVTAVIDLDVKNMKLQQVLGQTRPSSIL